MKKTRKAIAQAETKPMVAPRAVKNPLMNSVMVDPIGFCGLLRYYSRLRFLVVASGEQCGDGGHYLLV